MRHIQPTQASSHVPSRSHEYAYYALLAYAFLAGAAGISVPLVGAGGMVLLAVFCLGALARRATAVLNLLKFPLGCAVSFILVQVIVHGWSSNLRSFITWGLSLVIAQSLSLRPGFLHRFALVAFLIGLGTIPFMEYQSLTEDLARIGGGETGLANGNALAMWFGFCAVYFFTAGIETKRTGIRTVSWLMSASSLFVVGLTVSRGPLVGVAIAVTYALRRLLKRGFLPALCLLALSWIILVSGVFEKIATYYLERGTEESGRGFLWPAAWERFLDSWPAGVGAPDAVIFLPSHQTDVGPHNGLLYIALASGVIPLAFFLAYWIQTARVAYRANPGRTADAAFQVPLLIFAFLEMMILDTAFMSPWLIVVVSSVMVAGAPRRFMAPSRNRPTFPAARQTISTAEAHPFRHVPPRF